MQTVPGWIAAVAMTTSLAAGLVDCAKAPTQPVPAATNLQPVTMSPERRYAELLAAASLEMHNLASMRMTARGEKTQRSIDAHIAAIGEQREAFVADLAHEADPSRTEASAQRLEGAVRAAASVTPATSAPSQAKTTGLGGPIDVAYPARPY